MTSSDILNATENTQKPDALTPEQAQVILQFLQRTQLQGSEMAAYIDVFNALSATAKTGASGGLSA